MEIREFLELCAGNWFCQRTSYLLNPEKTENSKSEITITLLESKDTQILKVCEEHSLDASLSVGGIRSDWNNSVDWGKPKQTGFSLIIPIPETTYQGRLLQTSSISQQKKVQGKYSIGEDEAVTLVTELPEITIKERVWFASPNLRLRTSLIESQQGWTKTSFYSEIRKVTASK